MRRALVTLPVALLLAGCGGDDGREVLGRALDSVGEIRSGTLHVELLVEPRVATAREPFGFRLDGPFRFGELPTAEVEYTQIANGSEGTATFVLDENGAYVESDGERRDLDAGEVEDLRRTARAARGGGALIDVSGWVEDSETTDCPDSDDAVECVQGDLDPVETVNGLLTLLQATGERALALPDADADQLRDAVQKAEFFVMAGEEDGLLRDLRVDLDLALDVPDALQSALGELVGADVRFRIAVDDPKSG